MKCQLERERQLRIELERQMFPNHIRDLTTQVQIVQMQNEKMVGTKNIHFMKLLR